MLMPSRRSWSLLEAQSMAVRHKGVPHGVGGVLDGPGLSWPTPTGWLAQSPAPGCCSHTLSMRCTWAWGWWQMIGWVIAARQALSWCTELVAERDGQCSHGGRLVWVVPRSAIGICGHWYQSCVCTRPVAVGGVGCG